MSASAMTRQRAVIRACFLVLGAQVGVRAVGVCDIYLRFGLTPTELGTVSTVGVAAGILTLLGGAWLVDRLGRRPVQVVGLVGTGTSYLLTADVHTYAGLVGAWVLYGLACSLIDLGTNALASDHEIAVGSPVMVGLQSWFSLGAAGGALLSAGVLGAGGSYRPAFVGVGGVLVLLGLVLTVAPLPPVASTGSRRPAAGRPVWRIPVVLLAMAIVFTCFFGDGILETFLSTFIRTGSGGFQAGAAVAIFHLASWLGRSLFQRIVPRVGERTTITGAALVASVAVVAVLLAHDAVTMTACVAVVGLAISPIVPLGLSLAARAAGPQNGSAVGLVTAVGYVAFIVSPVTAGAVAGARSLTWGIAIVAVTTVIVGLLGQALPRSVDPDADQ